MLVCDRDLCVIEALQDGLPLVSRPYAAIGVRCSMSETEVIARVGALLEAGVMKRFGVVVRHHELGYRANAMVVWDVPDQRVAEIGYAFSQFPFVTLCYQRPRALPDWPYNLFCMIHGQNRESVLQHLAQLIDRGGFSDLPHEVLFSLRRFKQRGAVYRARTPAVPPLPVYAAEPLAVVMA